MKKILALVLSLVLVLSLCACGAKEEAPAAAPVEEAASNKIIVGASSTPHAEILEQVKAPLAEAADKVKGFISVELSMGQMIEDVRLATQCKKPVVLCNRTGGMIPTPEQVLESIRNMAKEGK